MTSTASSATAHSLATAADDVLDLDQLEERVERVLADELYWFPVRHGSPAVARRLEDAILARRPRLIFLEAPAGAEDMIPHLIDAETKPPVAIYSSFRDDENRLGLAGLLSPSEDVPARFASWYPLLAYSPELICLKAAKKVGARVVFFDLPHWALIRGGQESGEDVGERIDHEAREADSDAASEVIEEKAPAADAWELMRHSDFYRRLAEVAGYKSWDEAWDTLFEKSLWTQGRKPHGEPSEIVLVEEDPVEAFRRELTTFCAAARLTADPERLEWDGTLERERFMRQTIDATLAREEALGAADSMVVCGGFHLFMDSNLRDQGPPAQEEPTVRGAEATRSPLQAVPAMPTTGTVYTTVVAYSYARLSQAAGYAAGNRAPRFYQSAWEKSRSGQNAEDLLVEYVLKVIRRARRRGESLSPADSIAAAQHARLLARLRGRVSPVLDDMRGGVITCCVKGAVEEEGARLLAAMREVEIGNRIGRVCDGVDLAPIVKDFHEQVRDLELEEHTESDVPGNLRLDLRDGLGARRSYFFHRLRFLAIPFAEPLKNRTLGTIFSEPWHLRWSPQVDEALLEKGLYGDSVEAAAIAWLEEDLARQGLRAGACCKRLLAAADMDLPHLVQRLEALTRAAIDTDQSFLSLTEGFIHLQVLARRIHLRGLPSHVVEDLVARIFDRACFALPNSASAPASEEEAVVGGLRALAERVTSLRSRDPATDQAPEQAREQSEDGEGGEQEPGAGDSPPARLFTEQVELSVSASTVPFLRGAFLAILVEIRAREPKTLAREITGFARSAPEEMVHAGEFLGGVLKASKASLLLGADDLVAALDGLLRAADWESFLIMLPRLRGAFEELAPAQLSGISQRVAENYGLRERESLDFDTSVEAAAAITAVDARMAEILEAWEL